MKILFLFVLFFFAVQNISAQAIIFTGKKYIEYHPDYAEWDEWPDEWTAIDQDLDFKMLITPVVKGKIYKVEIYGDGEAITEMTLRYDATLSEEKRIEWDDEYVNCYKDENGDYLYAQKVSLETLSIDNSTWASNKESKIYFWVFSENYALLFK